MIKSLLDADENPPPGTKVVIEETFVEPSAASGEINSADQSAETRDILEIPPLNNKAQNVAEFSETPVDTTNSPITGTFAESSKPKNEAPMLFQTAYQPETQAETMRKSGLAYAAAITLFGSVIFMLIIGWFADLLLGSWPWGIVVGIVLGSLIGFFQFFRLTSQILKNKD